MRIGLVGPADGDSALLREAAEFLLGDCGVEQAVYLGSEQTLRGVVDRWATQVVKGVATEARFLEEALALALDADAAAIDALLSRDRELHRLSALRCLPAQPARAVELVDDKVVLFVHDKALLDPEDIANAFLIVYGRSKQSALHRFGPRTFFTPGPLSHGRVALIEREGEAHLAIAQFNPRTGEPRGRDILQVRRARVVVTP
jgi:hypothetical protein